MEIKQEGGNYYMDVHEFLKEKLEVFDALYDVIIIIDPIEKKSVIIENNCKVKMNENCNWILKREEFCDKSISMNAYLNNDTFVKIEYIEGKMLLINASPITFKEKIYIIEAIKDITTNSTFVVNNEIKGNNVENLVSEMNEKIVKDYLTGIYNRRYIDERLPIDVKNSIIEGSAISVIMADIDYFKNVNDTYGHLIGDEVLIDFARLISRSIREDIDWVGRYGGEEFLIVLKGIDSDGAYEVAEKIRQLVDETTFSYDNVDIHITSSFGVHGYKNEKLNLEELISQADKKLYVAKASGRNKTIVYI
ncbi:GGDEF domain-containing protein [Clostridium thailandense]|uniref:GGDEF domain-containing protein n=1 Tax=Clostridium thailandense TaxID=2794346 RepID=UPI00398989AB